MTAIIIFNTSDDDSNKMIYHGDVSYSKRNEREVFASLVCMKLNYWASANVYLYIPEYKMNYSQGIWQQFVEQVKWSFRADNIVTIKEE